MGVATKVEDRTCNGAIADGAGLLVATTKGLRRSALSLTDTDSFGCAGQGLISTAAKNPVR